MKQEVKTIGSSGQVYLGKKFAGQHVVVSSERDGVWLIQTTTEEEHTVPTLEQIHLIQNHRKQFFQSSQAERFKTMQKAAEHAATSVAYAQNSESTAWLEQHTADGIE